MKRYANPVMNAGYPTSPETIRDPAPDEICASVDLQAVAEILRRAHPQLDSEDIIARILDVLEQDCR